MPQIAGAWLAGTFDNDRAVAKAAQDALRKVFPTPEKLQGVRKAYQAPSLDFCQNAIDNETPQTLSDERTSSPDDVEAKYNRLIASVILLITSFLHELTVDETQKQENVYTDLLQDENLWKLSYHGDPQVRRAVHRLLSTCITRHANLVKPALAAIGEAYIGHGLRSDQTGTALNYLEALNALVALDSGVWLEHAKGAKGLNRLCSFLKRGSQLGTSDYWPNVLSLMRQLPVEVYAGNLKEAQEFLNAVAHGIKKKDEPRINLPAGWRAYVHVLKLLIDALTFEDMNTLIKDNVLPILNQYVRPNEKTATWELPSAAASSVIDQLLETDSVRAVVADLWPQVARQLIQDMQTSLPEQSKEFRTSQDGIVKEGQRWCSVHSILMRRIDSPNNDSPDLQKAAAGVVRGALDVLQRRNGKPYGAAAVADACLFTLDLDAGVTQSFEDFVRQKLPNLFCSPSASFLADLLYFFHDRTWFKSTWDETLAVVLEQQPDRLQALLSSPHVPPNFDLAASSTSLRSYVNNRTRQALDGESDWSFLDSLTKGTSKHFEDAIVNDELLANLTSSLKLDDEAPQALDGLHALMKTDRQAVERYLQNPEASQLLPRLLSLSESANEDIAHSALNLNSLVQGRFIKADGSAASHETLFKTIQTGLLEASDASVREICCPF